MSYRVPTDSAPGRLTIDLAALADNWRQLAKPRRAGTMRGGGEGHAYGIGLDRAAPALWAAGARAFFVAHLGEGFSARRVLPEEAEIYVLNGLEAGADPIDYAAHRLKPVIGSAAELERWPAFARGAGAHPVGVHLDTGMSRLGFDSLAPEKAMSARRGERRRPADEPFRLVGAAGRPDQRRRDPLFQRRGGVSDLAPRSPIRPASFWTRGRSTISPGLATPFMAAILPGRPNPMRPVATLSVAVQQTRWIEAGETCGYNAQWTARRRTRLATLARVTLTACRAGRARTTNVPGRRSPSRAALPPGRPDLDGPRLADVTELPEESFKAGDPAEFFGARSTSTILRSEAARSAISC